MRSFGYYIKEGLRNVFTHGFMSIAAVIAMVVCLFLTGIVTMVSYNLDINIINLQKSSEVVIFIEDTLSTREAKALGSEFNKISNIASMDFQSRDEALETYRVELGEDAAILDSFDADNNPFRNGFTFTLKDPELLDETLAQIRAVEGVARIRADEKTVNSLLKVQSAFRMVSAAMIIVMALISIFIISNTVKLAMFSRREEISIQKMVGATNWFIRWPFVIEGLFIGAIAGGLTYLALWGSYNELALLIVTTLPSFKMLAFESLWGQILGILVGIGALLGIGGSVTSIRRFMNV